MKERTNDHQTMTKTPWKLILCSIMVVVMGFGAMTTGEHLAASSGGPNFPSTGTDSTGVGTIAWINPGNVTADDTSYSSVTLGNNAVSDYLKGTGFNFSIPANATVNGIQVAINRMSSDNSVRIADQEVKLLKGGSVTGNNKADTATNWETVLTTRTYGGATDLWGGIWTPADINNPNFGMALSAHNKNTSSMTATVDFVTITVSYTVKITATAGTGGSISPSGVVNVASGTGKTFNISPSVGYHIADVLVDSVSVGALAIYSFTNVVANHTIAATFAQNAYTVTFNLGGHGTLTEGQLIQTVNHGASAVAPTLSVESGWIFAGWDASFNNVTSPLTVNAMYSQSSYTIDATAGAGGSIVPSGIIAVAAGADQSFVFVPMEGYDVADILVDGVSIGISYSFEFSDVDDNHSIQVLFTPLNSLRVMYPNGGEILAAGSPINITWNSVGVTGNIKIELSRDRGNNWETLTDFASGNSFQWMVTGPATSNGLIRLTSVDDLLFNDSSDAPFSITAAPDIAVLYNGTEITNGDSTPSASKGTDFGDTEVGSGGVSRTFTIANTGTGPLTGTVNPSGVFEVNASQHSFNISPNGTTTFTVTFNPPSTGLFTSDITILSNDPDAEHNFHFTVRGIGIITPPMNTPPVVNDDSCIIGEDGILNVTSLGILANDFDYDPGTTLTAILVTSPSHGILSLNADGSFNYTPFSNWNGTDLFTYKANDGEADSEMSATVTIVVDSVNDAPVLGFIGNKTVNEGENLVFTLFATDIDSTVLTYSANPSVHFDASSHLFSWTPTFSEAGTYHVIFTVMDNGIPAAIDSETITITVVDATRTITASAGSGGSISPNGAVDVAYGTDKTFIVTPSTGHHIADVLVDGGSVGAMGIYTFTNVMANHTINAIFTINTYTVTFDAGGHGTFTGDLVQMVTYGGSAAAPVITADAGWSCTGWDKAFNNVTSDLTVTAQYRQVTKTITASAGSGGSISPNGAVNVAYGTDKIFSVIPVAGFHIADVLVDGTSVKAQLVNQAYTFSGVVTNHIIIASFAPDVVIPSWDLDGNHVCDVLDLISVGNKIGQSGTMKEDIDANGIIDVLDLIIIGNHIGQTW